MKIYERYFLKELFKIFALFISSFYLLYILIDYSTHMKTFSQEGLRVYDVLLYYLLQFVKQAEILLPLAFIVGIIKVLTSLNLKNEMVALLASGLSFRVLLRPFFAAAFFISLALFVNFEFFYPKAALRLDTFEHVYFKPNQEHLREVNHLRLQDHSLLLYSSYDAKRGSFSDVYWIISADELYRIQNLFPFAGTPRGTYVDHIVRNGDMEMRKKESFVNCSFPDMKFLASELDNALREAAHPPEWQSLIELAKSISAKQFNIDFKKMNDREASLRTHFYYKITIPWLSVLALFAISPFCLKFKRNFPVFLTYAAAILASILFLALIGAMRVFGESQIMPPFWALATPYILLFTLFGYRYVRL